MPFFIVNGEPAFSGLFLVCAFALGFVTNRLMNNQNILTGDLEEGEASSSFKFGLSTGDTVGALLIALVLLILFARVESSKWPWKW